MPLQQETIKSRYFKDISMSFKVNPINYDLISVSNEAAISRSIRNLVLTNKGERPFEPEIGCDIQNSLFENLDFVAAASIKSTITYTIETYEPRVNLQEVIVQPNFENNRYDVQITYEIIGMDIPSIEIEFSITEPTRY
tara:strand:+ start:960 stop:1376 length:417 start_codon:yes stop_codon:yes gene_type:complete